MKREIKFRVWDAEGKCLFQDGMKYLTAFFDDTGELFVGVIPEEGSPLVRFELSQFTGLKDKNGKEIYEGDILAMDNMNYGYGDPNEKEYRFYVIEDIIDFHYDYMEHCISHEAVVIGNIYENPELLK